MKLWDFCRKWECFEDLLNLEVHDEIEGVFTLHDISNVLYSKLWKKEIKSFCLSKGKLIIKVK